MLAWERGHIARTVVAPGAVNEGRETALINTFRCSIHTCAGCSSSAETRGTRQLT